MLRLRSTGLKANGSRKELMGAYLIVRKLSFPLPTRYIIFLNVSGAGSIHVEVIEQPILVNF